MEKPEKKQNKNNNKKNDKKPAKKVENKKEEKKEKVEEPKAEAPELPLEETNLYKETGDIYVVADCLGHKDVNTTKKHYAAITEDIRREAIGVVKLRKKD